MSSTNRSDARNAHKSDYYTTPVDKIVEFLNAFNEHEDILLKPDTLILDPAAGGCLQHPMSYPEALKRINVGSNNIYTIDIRQDSLADVKGDYLKMDCKGKYDVIFTNPPFVLARDFIEKALDDIKKDGFVIMLLRLNFLESKKRKDLWGKYMPKYIFTYSERLSFTDDGKTDSVAYAHYCWQKGYNPEFSKIKVI